jgi:membrane protein
MDHDQPLEREDETAARKAEEQALMLAARVRLRRAEDAAVEAPWYRRSSARRAVRRAQDALADALADAEAENVRPRA